VLVAREQRVLDDNGAPIASTTIAYWTDPALRAVNTTKADGALVVVLQSGTLALALLPRTQPALDPDAACRDQRRESGSRSLFRRSDRARRTGRGSRASKSRVTTRLLGRRAHTGRSSPLCCTSSGRSPRPGFGAGPIQSRHRAWSASARSRDAASRGSVLPPRAPTL